MASMLSATARAVIHPRRPKVTYLPRPRSIRMRWKPWHASRAHLYRYGNEGLLSGPEMMHGSVTIRSIGIRTRRNKDGVPVAIKNRDGTPKGPYTRVHVQLTTPQHCRACWINRLEAYTRGI